MIVKAERHEQDCDDIKGGEMCREEKFGGFKYPRVPPISMLELHIYGVTYWKRMNGRL